MNDNYTLYVLFVRLLLLAFDGSLFLGGAPPPALLKFWVVVIWLFKQSADINFKRLGFRVSKDA